MNFLLFYFETLQGEIAWTQTKTGEQLMQLLIQKNKFSLELFSKQSNKTYKIEHKIIPCVTYEYKAFGV